MKQSAEIVGKLFERYGTAKTAKLPPAAVKKGYTPQQIKWMMLQTIPHIGGVVAKRIVEAVQIYFLMVSLLTSMI